MAGREEDIAIKPAVGEEMTTIPPAEEPDGSCAPKPKRGRPPGALNKKTIAKRAFAKQSALAAAPQATPPRDDEATAQSADAKSETRRPKKRRPSTSSSSGRSATVVVKRRKKRVVVLEESDSSPSPVVVKHKKKCPNAPRLSPSAASEQSAQQSAPMTLDRLGNALRDVHLDRMLARHQQYQGHFSRLK